MANFGSQSRRPRTTTLKATDQRHDTPLTITTSTNVPNLEALPIIISGDVTALPITTTPLMPDNFTEELEAQKVIFEKANQRYQEDLAEIKQLHGALE